MIDFFRDLVDGYNQAKSDAVKSTIYGAMVEFVDSYQPGYTCYDMDMYIALYKCATTSPQRKHALNFMQEIIDDGFQDHYDLIEELRLFVEMKDFLDESDQKEFDEICKKSLDYFKNALKGASNEGFLGQLGIITPDAQLEKAKGELKEICKIIISAGMRDLESYHEAVDALVTLGILSREYISRLFSKGKFFSWVFSKEITSLFQ